LERFSRIPSSVGSIMCQARAIRVAPPLLF
jgi:hypothetical protein